MTGNMMVTHVGSASWFPILYIDSSKTRFPISKSSSTKISAFLSKLLRSEVVSPAVAMSASEEQLQR